MKCEGESVKGKKKSEKVAPVVRQIGRIYQIVKRLPKELKGQLPSPEQISRILEDGGMKCEVGSLKGERKSEWVFSNFTLLTSHFISAATIKRNFEELGI